MITVDYLRRLTRAVSLNANFKTIEFDEGDDETVVHFEIDGFPFRVYVPDHDTPYLRIGYNRTVHLLEGIEPDFSAYVNGSILAKIIKEWDPHDYS